MFSAKYPRACHEPVGKWFMAIIASIIQRLRHFPVISILIEFLNIKSCFEYYFSYITVFSTPASLSFCLPAVYCYPTKPLPCPGGSVVSMPDSWPGGCEFDPQLRQTFSAVYFRLSPLQKHVRKVVCGFGKKVVLELVWESQETHLRHRTPWYYLSC